MADCVFSLSLSPTAVQVGGFVRDVSESIGQLSLDFFIEGFNAVPITLFLTLDSPDGRATIEIIIE